VAELSDLAWADICAAAGRTPDVEAHAMLTGILFDEYPAFKYDRERVAQALKRSTRMLKLLDAFAELYRQTWLPELPRDQFLAVLEDRAVPITDDAKTKTHFVSLAKLRRRAEAGWLVARAIGRANAGRKSAQREWLYYRLCSVWLDHFDGELTYSRPSHGGSPYGPLIAFILAAFRQVVSEDALPSPEAVGDAIARERNERENCRQLILQLRRRIGV
jgi:hypothetical protein